MRADWADVGILWALGFRLVTMRRRQFLARTALALLGAWRLPRGVRAQSGTPRRLLAVTHSAGYGHDVVTRRSPDRLSRVEETLKTLGDQSGAFELTFVYSKEDCQGITPDILKSYDGVFFYTTGDVPFPQETRTALLDFVSSGKGFSGAHSATDTYYTLPGYGEMLGAYFDGHPWHQGVRITVEDRQHAATRQLGDSFEIADEIYQFRAPWSRDRMSVLLSLNTSSVDLSRPGVNRGDGDFALSWWRQHGAGRVFYTALGHDGAVWQDQRFRQHLLGGIRWSLGDPNA